MQILNTPNVLSFLRILLVPVLVVVLLTQGEGKELIGLAIFLVAAFTDFLDGFLARRRKQVTPLGQLIDPAADKILMSAALIALVELGLAPAWMVVVIVAREFAVSTLRAVAATEGKVLAAGWSGKIKTIVQFAAIVALLLGGRIGWAGEIAPWLLWAATFMAVYSGLDYFIRQTPPLVRIWRARAAQEAAAASDGPEGQA